MDLTSLSIISPNRHLIGLTGEKKQRQAKII